MCRKSQQRLVRSINNVPHYGGRKKAVGKLVWCKRRKHADDFGIITEYYEASLEWKRREDKGSWQA